MKELPVFDDSDIEQDEQGVFLIDSRIVARRLGKRHSDTLRDISRVVCPEEIRACHYINSEYITAQNKSQPCIKMTSDGYSLLMNYYRKPKTKASKQTGKANKSDSVIDAIENLLIDSITEPLKLDDNLKKLSELKLLDNDLEKHEHTYQAVLETIIRHYKGSLPNEWDIHEWYKRNIESIHNGKYQIAKVVNDPKHIPDVWLSDEGGKKIPVEIKLYAFKSTHLKQLQRYINRYGCTNGIAVGTRLECELPPNIEFVSYSMNDVLNA